MIRHWRWGTISFITDRSDLRHSKTLWIVEKAAPIHKGRSGRAVSVGSHLRHRTTSRRWGPNHLFLFSRPSTGRPRLLLLLPAPVGHEIVSHVGQLVLFGAIGKHGPYLRVSANLAFKHDMPPVRRPAWEIIAPRIVRKLQPALAGDVHDVDVLPARRAGAVLPVPTKGEHGAVGRPGRRDGVASIRQPLDVGSVLVHGVDLRKAGAAAYPRDLRVGSRVPGG